MGLFVAGHVNAAVHSHSLAFLRLFLRAAFKRYAMIVLHLSSPQTRSLISSWPACQGRQLYCIQRPVKLRVIFRFSFLVISRAVLLFRAMYLLLPLNASRLIEASARDAQFDFTRLCFLLLSGALLDSGA